MYNIVLTPDDNYVEHAAATITSILENCGECTEILFNIVDVDLSNKKKNLLKQLIERYNAKIKFISINKKLLENAFVDRHISKASYYRILCSDSLDSSIEKFLYLDCDLIVRKDIRNLFNINMQNHILCAVRNYDFTDEIIKHLDLPKGTPYFNAGVLLINKIKWDSNEIRAKLINYINKHTTKLINHDQDALNAVLYNSWIELPIKWNVRTPMFDCSPAQAGAKDINHLKDILNDPAIVHFTTNLKPWHYFSNHKYKEEYYIYLKKSGVNSEKKNNILKLISKPTYLFGASKKGKEAYEFLSEKGINIVGFIDNNEQKWGTYLEGLKIFNIHEILNDDKDFLIIITSQYQDEIKEQLDKMNLVEKKSYFTFGQYLKN